MKQLLVGVALTLVGLILPASAAAQTPTPLVKNPSIVEWTCPDHDLDDGHELKIIRIEGTNKVVITTIKLGDPGYFDEVGKGVRSDLNVQPIAFGEYVATMRAMFGTVSSEESAESNRFQRAPGAPSIRTIR